MDIIINDGCDNRPSNSQSLETEGDFLLNVLTALGYDPLYPPLGDLLRLYKQLEGKWIIASPVHWEATHNDAMITAVKDSLHLSDSVSRIWFAEISQFLSQDQFDLVYYDANTWLINIDKKPPIKSISLGRILNQSLMPALAGMDESMYWQRLMTELQMFMGQHPLNSVNTLAMPVNGLWFWGGGTIAPTVDRPIMTDDAVISGVYKHCLPLDLTLKPEKNSLLAIHNFEPSMKDALDQLTKQQAIKWHWNNTAYQTPIKRWWRRFWKG